MDILKKLNGCEKQEGAFVLHGDCADIKLVFLTDEIVRVRCSFEKSFPEESYVLMTTAWEDRLDPLFEGERKRGKGFEPSVDERDGVISFASKKLSLNIRKDPFEMVLTDCEGEELFSTEGLPTFVRDSNDRRVSYVRMKEDDAFYGFGEKTGPLNKNKMFLRQRGTDAFGYDPYRCDTLYKHIPFYIRLDRESRKAVGVFYHNFYESVFNMGAEKSNYWPRYSYYQTDGGDLDLFLIGGGAISRIIDNYTLLTGRPALLPKRALGYQGSSMYYAELSKDCADALMEFVDTVHQEGFPIDGFHLSSGYTTVDGKRCVFEWNNERFKDPSAFFEGMEQAGASVVPNVKPGVLLTHPEYEVMEKEKVFVRDSADKNKPALCKWWGGDGSMWDFTDPVARKVWKKYLSERVVGLGVNSVWNDNCEYDGVLDKDAAVSFDGKESTIGALKPLMANLMCKLSNEVIEEKDPDVRPYSVCRAGAAGIQRYAQTWCGDNYTSWEALRGNLPTILGMGLSGQPAEGADIGGFAGPVPSKELFVRWVQNGIFQPRFSIHSASDDNTVTEPWMYPEVKELIRQLILFRYRMIPYMYSLEHEASECGAPLMRPLVYEFQDNAFATDVDDEFMFGSDILVANVLEEGADSRMVYLPEGCRWYDMNDDFAMHQGGQIGPVKADLETVPMFIREGAIVPFALNQPMNLERDKVTGLHLYLAPEEASDEEFRISTFTLYDDDGVSNDYRKGVFLKTQITMTGYDIVNVDFVHEGEYESPVKDMLVEVIRKDRAPISVALEGLDFEAESSFAKELTHFLNYDKFMAAQSGWYYHMSKRTVLVKYENPHEDYRLTVSFREFDLIGL
jgi:alpha-glucosidase